MHTLYARFNNVSAMLSTCVMVLLGAISLSSFVFSADPKGQLGVSSIQVYAHRSLLPPTAHGLAGSRGTLAAM